MRRLLPLILLLFAAALGVFAMVMLNERDDAAGWTTESPRAREAFDQALEALRKRYIGDAVKQLDRALELDPSFAMARLYRDLLDPTVSHEDKLSTVQAVDTSRLNSREAALSRAIRALFEGDPQKAREEIDACLKAHPDDPYLRSIACEDDWDRLDWKAAEHCYQDLIARHPNWVEAQNRLGFLAMSAGRFQVAEDRFEAYRFVAPDQATPYSSLAELAMLRGDLATAEVQLDRALAIKPDFCDALLHRVSLRSFERRFAQAREALFTLSETPACAAALPAKDLCAARMRIAYLEADYEGAWQASEACPEDRMWSALAHRTALLTGRGQASIALEQAVAANLDNGGEAMVPAMQQAIEGLLLSFEGERLLAAGHAAEAAQRFEDSDALNRYWGWRHGWTFKLYNQVDRIQALERAGKQDEAARVRSALDRVNPIIESLFAPGATAVADLAADR